MDSQQIKEQIRALVQAQRQAEKAELNAVVDALFSGMTKQEIRKKIKDMMEASPLMESEVRALLEQEKK